MPGLRFHLVASVAFLGPTIGVACPFCSTQGQTLSGEVAQADLILLGKVQRVRQDPNDFTRGSTDLAIESVVKPHEFLRGKSVIEIPRVIRDSGAGRYLVFASLYPRSELISSAAVGSPAVLANPTFAQLDPYRGEAVEPGSRLPGYLKAAIAIRSEDTPTRLRFFFDHLDDPDLTIGNDAMTEFGNSAYDDVRVVAEKLPAEKLLKWLKDPNTPANRFGLYGLLLGHCGTKADATAVRAILDDKDKAYSSGLDGLLVAYVLLDHKAGWDYLLAITNDPKRDFLVRYAALKVLKFFWEYRSDLISRPQVLEGMRNLIAQPDMADMPIEDLRKWGAWDQSEYVLSFADRESHRKVPIVRRAILRFALTAPDDDPKSKGYVERVRREDPERVKQVEAMIRDERKSEAARNPQAVSGGS